MNNVRVISPGSIHYDMDGKPIGMFEWARAFESTDRSIGDTRIVNIFGFGYWVSTVWLGIDHRFFGSGPPLIFETMVFELRPWWFLILMPRTWRLWRAHRAFMLPKLGPDVFCDRYSTKLEAMAGHDAAVEQYGGHQ